MADLHESGLFVDLNEDATMYDVPEDEGGRPQVKAARPAEKYMYMAIRWCLFRCEGSPPILMNLWLYFLVWQPW